MTMMVNAAVRAKFDPSQAEGRPMSQCKTASETLEPFTLRPGPSLRSAQLGARAGSCVDTCDLKQT